LLDKGQHIEFRGQIFDVRFDSLIVSDCGFPQQEQQQLHTKYQREHEEKVKRARNDKESIAKLRELRLPNTINEQILKGYPEAVAELTLAGKIDLNGDGVDDYVIDVGHRSVSMTLRHLGV